MNTDSTLDLGELHFYWRTAPSPAPEPGIPVKLPLTLGFDHELGLLKQLVRPETLDALRKVYQLSYNIGYLQEGHALAEAYGASFRRFLGEHAPLEGKKRVLEIGCGAALLLKELKECGHEVEGVDPSPVAKEACARYGIKFTPGFYGPTHGTGYDFIYHHNVLEHVEDPLEFLRWNHSHLAEGGRVVVGVPDCTESVAKGDVSIVWHEHISYFDGESLGNMLAKAGFTDVTVARSTYGGLLYGTGVVRAGAAIPTFRRTPGKFNSFREGFNERRRRVEAHVRGVLNQPGATLGLYVPLRLIAYLSLMNLDRAQLSRLRFFDDDTGSQGKYYDGFPVKIEGLEGLKSDPPSHVLIGSANFGAVIKSKIQDAVGSRTIVHTLLDV